VRSINDVDTSLPLWIAVFNHKAESSYSYITEMCRTAGFKNILLPTEYYARIEKQMGWRYWLTNPANYIDTRARSDIIFNAFEDDDSRRQYLNTMRFRFGLAQAPEPCRDPQYFPNIPLPYNGPITFVDGGAYDGDTLIQASELLPIGEAFAFEPDPTNFTRLSHNVAGLSFPVTCFPCGLSDTTERVKFSAGAGEAGAVGTGDTLVQCVTLAECLVGRRIDYLKLDVEGHELAVLRGAERLIRRDKPILAVAGYHRWTDVWEVPEFMLAHGYKIYYRTHGYNTFDSVFYGVSV
jgi:FkbM family methyltransferase